MSPRVRKTMVVAMVVAAFASFAVMVYGIVNWDPLFSMTVFVWMFLAAGGFMVLFGGPRVDVARSEPMDRSVEEPVRESAAGTGSGYCIYCGSPLQEFSLFCGACGRHLRWTSAGS